MRKKGEISVFLSLITVCILSLFLGLVESARTAGARLHLETAANSAMSSVMSHYNRNLWDMYHVLFLETASPQAVEETFSSYFGSCLEGGDLYPMKIRNVSVSGMDTMTDQNGEYLEQEILSYISYRLPNVAADLAGLTAAAADADRAGEFRSLLSVSMEAGKKTKNLEKCRQETVKILKKIGRITEDLYDAAEEEQADRMVRKMEDYGEQVENYSEASESFEKEYRKVAAYYEEMKLREADGYSDETAKQSLEQELLTYERVLAGAEKQRTAIQNTERILYGNLDVLENLNRYLEEYSEEYPDEDSEQQGAFGAEVLDMLSGLEMPPEAEEREADMGIWEALDRLEAVFGGGLLGLVLPEGTEISKRNASLRQIPSALRKETDEAEEIQESQAEASQTEASQERENPLKRFAVNEYCLLNFDSFRERCDRNPEPAERTLEYELEYILCGESADRKNLEETVEKLIAVRAAMNFLHLMNSSVKKAEADTVAAAVSCGNLAVQYLVSILILSLWALGEAVCDVRVLMKGGGVSFWKQADEWQLDLQSLLKLEFPNLWSSEKEGGNDYQDYLRILLFLMDRGERNYRMMDLIQWNVSTIQSDFRVQDCKTNIVIHASVTERHLFAMSQEYIRSVEVTGAY